MGKLEIMERLLKINLILISLFSFTLSNAQELLSLEKAYQEKTTHILSRLIPSDHYFMTVNLKFKTQKKKSKRSEALIQTENAPEMISSFGFAIPDFSKEDVNSLNSQEDVKSPIEMLSTVNINVFLSDALPKETMDAVLKTLKSTNLSFANEKIVFSLNSIPFNLPTEVKKEEVVNTESKPLDAPLPVETMEEKTPLEVLFQKIKDYKNEIFTTFLTLLVLFGISRIMKSFGENFKQEEKGNTNFPPPLPIELNQNEKSVVTDHSQRENSFIYSGIQKTEHLLNADKKQVSLFGKYLHKSLSEKSLLCVYSLIMKKFSVSELNLFFNDLDQDLREKSISHSEKMTEPLYQNADKILEQKLMSFLLLSEKEQSKNEMKSLLNSLKSFEILEIYRSMPKFASLILNNLNDKELKLLFESLEAQENKLALQALFSYPADLEKEFNSTLKNYIKEKKSAKVLSPFVTEILSETREIDFKQEKEVLSALRKEISQTQYLDFIISYLPLSFIETLSQEIFNSIITELDRETLAKFFACDLTQKDAVLDSLTSKSSQWKEILDDEALKYSLLISQSNNQDDMKVAFRKEFWKKAKAIIQNNPPLFQRVVNHALNQNKSSLKLVA